MKMFSTYTRSPFAPFFFFWQKLKSNITNSSNHVSLKGCYVLYKVLWDRRGEKNTKNFDWVCISEYSLLNIFILKEKRFLNVYYMWNANLIFNRNLIVIF